MASVDASRREDIQPSPAKKPKIESGSEDVAFSDNDYSSDDYDSTRYYDKNDKERERQYQICHAQVENSEGFDINFREFTCKFGYKPVSWRKRRLLSGWPGITDGELIKKLALFAIDQHNREEKKQLKLVKLVKANWHPCAGTNYYISCVVKDSWDGNLKTYQLEVQNFRDEITVHMVREKLII